MSTLFDTAPRRLYLIDGYSTIFRAFYAIQNLSNSKGEPTNAVFGFLQILRKLLRDEQPEYLGVALDVSRKTIRSEKFPEYKANRSPMPEDLRPQIPWIRKVLEAYNIPVQELQDFEADDVLGTLAAKASAEGYEVVLVSADKDLMQLVGPKVKMLHTSRQKLYGPAEVEEDFGVPPHQVVDVLALMGDASDNVPGVKGIGQKGAVNLIREYETLENLLEHAGELKRKNYREGLTNHRDMAELSKDLVTIRTELPVDFDPEALELSEPSLDGLREIFTALDFYTLLEELEREAPQAEAPPVREVEDAAAWSSAVAELPKRLAVALVGPEEDPVGVVVGGAPVEEGEESEGEDAEEAAGPVFADLRREGLREAVVESLAGWFRDSETHLLGHHLKEVLRLASGAFGGRFSIAAEIEDLMLVSYVLKPSRRSHDLDELALERLGHTARTLKEVGFTKKATPEVGDEGLRDLAAERLDLLIRLVPAFRKELEGMEEAEGVEGADRPVLEGGFGARHLQGLYDEIEEPLLPVLLSMEEAGVELDSTFLAGMSKELGEEMAVLEAEIHRIAGEPFNLNSPSQLGEILFEKLEYPVIKRTRKTRAPSTSADVLKELADRGYDLPKYLMRFRELSKLKSTYIDALPELVAGDGRVHTRFNQAVATTGRLSSAHPNLQNIPIRTELGHRVRRAFVAPEGHRLLAADYSQVELRILAHIAQEQALLTAFQEGKDIHRATAAVVFEVGEGLVSDEQRRAAKTINFGIIYGMSAFGLAANLKIPQGQAQEFIDAYMARYPGVKGYMDETLAGAEKLGRVETMYGRVRYLSDIRSKNRNLRENARRMAINARIQGTAADIMKVALIAIHQRLGEQGLAARLLLTVHDEVVLEVPEAEVERAGALVKEAMEGVCTLDVPLVVDLGVGTSWYDAKD
ncbi:MAG: DNA polymerase I [Acidobacteriota bacterium]